ncbi:MAG: hypothetical protein OHK0024_14930 [Thalassobaculales bacterium]
MRELPYMNDSMPDVSKLMTPERMRVQQLLDQKANALKMFRDGLIDMTQLNEQLQAVKREMAKIRRVS